MECERNELSHEGVRTQSNLILAALGVGKQSSQYKRVKTLLDQQSYRVCQRLIA
jgi:hypothetical protein